jgi:hypothetical protein
MLIPCSRSQAVIGDLRIRLDGPTPGAMVWDEHGGTYVLRVDELAAVAATGQDLIRSLEEFAAQQQLPLAPPPGPELLEEAVLAACHLPEQNLFVFAEGPRLVVKKRGAAVELAVTGDFKTRRVPCRETDLVIHLTKAAMARLVALVLNLARTGG